MPTPYKRDLSTKKNSIIKLDKHSLTVGIQKTV